MPGDQTFNNLTVNSGTFNGGMTTTGTHLVTGTATVNNLNVSGVASYTSMSLPGTLSVTGNSTLGNVSMSGTVSSTGNVSVSGLTSLINVSASGTVSSTGNVVVRGNLQKVISDSLTEIWYNDAVTPVLKKYKIVHKPTNSTITEWNSLSNDLIISTRLSTWDTLVILDPLKVDYGSLIKQFEDFTRRMLIQMDENGNIIPDLATDLGTHSQDYKTWTFTLQSGIKYEDNTTVTAADIKYSVSRYFDPGVSQTAFPIQSLLDLNGMTYKGPYNADQSNVAAFDNAVTVDTQANSITFLFKDAQTNPLRSIYNSYIIPIPQASDSPSRYWRSGQTAADRNNPISCGPYKITSVDSKGLVYEKNTYWSAAKDPYRTQAFTKIFYIPFMSTQLLNAALENDIIPNLSILNGVYGVPTKSTTASGFPGRYLGISNYKQRYPDNVGDVGDSIFATMLSFNLGNITDYNARAAIFWGTNIKSYIDKAGGSDLQKLQDSLGNATLYPDYQPTSNNINDPRYSQTSNAAVATYYLNQLQSSNLALYTRMTTTGLNLLEYTGIVGGYDGMVASLKSVGIILNVTTKTKAEVFGPDSDPSNTGRYGTLVENPKWDLFSLSFGDYTVLDFTNYMLNFVNIQNDVNGAGFSPGFVVSPHNPVTKDAIIMDPNHQSLVDKITQAKTETNAVTKQALITEAMNICMDNYFIILPINIRYYTVEGTLISGSQISGDGLGANNKKTRYIC